MRFDVVSLFPGMFAAVSENGIPRRAREDGLWSLAVWNPRDFTGDNHRTVDERPYGGGPGMVMKLEPLRAAIQDARRSAGPDVRVLYMSPQGRRLDQAGVRGLAARPGVILVAGRYEGIDERVIASHIDEEISIGDFVVTGGELAALCVIDAIVRLLPHALGNAESSEHESFTDGLLEYPQYTRPARWRDTEVPPVLLGGNHAAIASWRAARSLERTQKRRPDLLHDTSVRTAPSLGGRTTSYEERK